MQIYEEREKKKEEEDRQERQVHGGRVWVMFLYKSALISFQLLLLFVLSFFHHRLVQKDTVYFG